jgi:hypothetical protein
MSFESNAQLYVVDPAADVPSDGNLALVPLEVPLEVSEFNPHEPEHEHESHEDHKHEEHEHEHEDGHPFGHTPSESLMEVGEPVEVSIVIEELPGAPKDSKDPEPELEVSEEPPMKIEDLNDAKPKKDPKWDWEAHGPKGFIAWVKSRCDDVPKHSGQDSAGLERAMAYLDKLDGEISRAMRMDLDGELDANQIEKVRSMIDDGIARLHDRLDKVKKVKKSKRSKKKTSDFDIGDTLVKEAQKITGVGGVMVVVDLLTSRIARTMINGMVSGGHDINDIFVQQVKEYGLNKREQACVRQLVQDMGYALREDRGYSPDEDYDFADSSNADFSANYKG